MAEALALPAEYFTALRDDLKAKRDLFVPGLRDIGFEVYQPLPRLNRRSWPTLIPDEPSSPGGLDS